MKAFRISSLILFACTLAVAARATAQDSRLMQRFPATSAARLQGVIDSAQGEGLPAEPLILRALEGGAKQASLEQIVSALDRLRAALRDARATLAPGAETAELTTAAAALQAGMPKSQLAELRQLRAGMTLTAPLGAYLDLTARGARPDLAWDRIADLARHRASDNDFVRLTPLDVDPNVRSARQPAGAPPPGSS